MPAPQFVLFVSFLFCLHTYARESGTHTRVPGKLLAACGLKTSTDQRSALLMELDEDKSGMIERSEFATWFVKRGSGLDLDGDAGIGVSEDRASDGKASQVCECGPPSVRQCPQRRNTQFGEEINLAGSLTSHVSSPMFQRPNVREVI